MHASLAGKVVVVTGGTSGIGEATARAASDAGATVVLLARRQDALDAALDRLGPSAAGFSCDVASPDSVREAFRRISDLHGRVDALLNVAGVTMLKYIGAFSDDDIAAIVGTNYLGPVHTTRAAIPLLEAAGGGDVVNVSSEATLWHMPLASLYTSTKAALESFSAAMNRELRAAGIRVSLVRVGTTATPMATKMPAEDREVFGPVLKADGFFERAGKPMDPAWVADTILFAITRPRGQMVDVLHARSFA